MPYYSKEDVEKAREMDLLTYLKMYEPTELVKVHGNTYSTREHDSLKISNGKWMWWSKGIGGASALDYLIKVKGESFTDAVNKILSSEGKHSPTVSSKSKKLSSKRLLLPDKSPTNDVVITYLTGRGIDREIIDYLIERGMIYESLPYHNCIFMGFGEDGIERFACFRGTGKEKLMGDAAGSDKRYSFRITSLGRTLHVFESPIDLLSYATLIKINGGGWKQDSMLSLGGVYVSGSKYRLPAALKNFLENRLDIELIVLHLDSDYAGRCAAEAIKNTLKNDYQVIDDPPRIGKDVNDELINVRKIAYEY